MIKSEAQLKIEGFTLVTGFRDVLVSYDIWQLDIPELKLTQVYVRDVITGNCGLSVVRHKGV